FQQPLPGDANNTAGSIDIAASRALTQFPIPSGTIALATFQFRGKLEGVSFFTETFSEVALASVKYDLVVSLPRVVVRTPVVGPPAKIAAVGALGQSAAVGNPLAGPFTVQVTDAANVAIEGVTIAWAITGVPSSATGQSLAAVSVTDDNGQATALLTLGLKSGDYTVTATLASVTGSPVTFTGTATPGPAVKLAFLAAPTGGAEGIPFAPQPVVAVQDANGNTVSNSNKSILLTLSTNPSSGILSCTINPVTAVAGVAAFTNCSVDKAGVNYTMSVATSGLTGATSSQFTVIVRAGNVWAPQTSGTANNLLGISAANLSSVWAVGTGGQILKTAGGGAAWAPQTSGVSSQLNGVAGVDAITAWAVGDGGVLLKTTDGGTNWGPQASNVTSRLNAIAAAGSGTGTAWAVGDGGVVLNTTVGAVWAPQNSGTTAQLNAASAFDTNVVWAVGDGGVITASANGGVSWGGQTSGVSTRLTGVTAATSTIAWAVGTGGVILRTINGGTTWTKQTSGVATDLSAVAAASSVVVYAVGANGVILRTGDGGATWAPQPSGVVTALRSVTAAGGVNAWTDGDAGVILQTSTAKLTIGTGAGQSAVVNTSLTNPFKVSVTDPNGAVLSGMPITWAVNGVPSGAVNQAPVPGLSLTDLTGGAETLLRLGTKVGVYVVTASSPGLAGSPVTFTAEGLGGAAATLALASGNNQTGAVLTELGQPMVATVQDIFQNPTQGAAINFTLTETPSGAVGQDANTTLAGLQTTFTVSSDVNGQAKASLMLGNRPGAYRVDVTSGSIPKVSFTENAVAGLPAKLSLVSGDGQRQGIGATLAQSLVVSLQDAQGNPVQGVDVAFAITQRPTGTTGEGLTFTVATTTNIGLASTNLVLGSMPGEYKVEASVAALPKVVFTLGALDVTPARAALYTGEGQSGQVGLPLAQAFAVKVFNVGGTAQSGVTVDFVITGTPGSAANMALSLASAVTDSLGVAASVLTFGDLPGGYQVTATCAACTVVLERTVTFSAPASAPPAVTIARSAGDGQVGLTSRPLERSFLVVVKDVSGAASPSAAVTFAVTKAPTGGGAASVSAGTTTTTSQGLASTLLTLGAVPGEYQVTAKCTSCGANPTVIFSATASLGAARIVKVSGDGQYGAGSGSQNRSVREPMVIEVQDTLGNPLSNVPVTFNTNLGTVTTGTGTTNAGGRASVGLNFGTVGVHTVTAGCPACVAATNSTTFTAEALPVLTLQGSVVGVDVLGRPLASPAVVGAGVTVSQIGLGMSFTTTTNAAGAFTLSMAAGGGSLSVTADGFAPVPNRSVNINAGGVQSPLQADLVIQAVEPGVTIQGKVTRDGNPVINGFVAAIEVDPSTVTNPTPSKGARTVSTFTDNNGNYTLAVPRNTFWKITATSYQIGSADLDLNNNQIPDIV
ncbi:MAG: Ig-like domain-containing protein, partial [Chloroflexi bacterium]|nr:Ig-like domain-containing protein [Chloroflexota bacterium]